MICNKCSTLMAKNGTRNGKQRYKCSVCGYEKEILITNNILVIPDLHIPFEHSNALKFCSDLKKEYDCSTIIQIGDIADQYGFSRYARDPDALTTREEVKLAITKISEWAQEFPDLTITIGNHCRRIQKRLYEIGIPSDIVLKTINEIFGMPKTWKWVSEKTINNITYLHGSKAGEYAHVNTAKAYRNSVVIGHTHSTLGVDWTAGIHDKIFGANCGCLIDQAKYAFYYAREMTRRPTLGAIIVLNGKYPLTIPMEE